MAFVPVANTAKVALLFTQYGQHLVNTLWFKKASPITSADLTTLCTALNSWVIAEMLPNQGSTVTYNGSEAVDMTTAGGTGVLVPVTSGNTGGIAGGGLPTNVTASVKFLTGLTGRSHRGRNYFIGLTNSGISGDELLSGSVTNILGIYDALGSYLVSTAFDQVIASLYSGVDSTGKPIPRAAGVTTVVVSYAMDIALDAMRRRLEGRGN
jgi:hypothetical protein